MYPARRVRPPPSESRELVLWPDTEETDEAVETERSSCGQAVRAGVGVTQGSGEAERSAAVIGMGELCRLSAMLLGSGGRRVRDRRIREVAEVVEVAAAEERPDGSAGRSSAYYRVASVDGHIDKRRRKAGSAKKQMQRSSRTRHEDGKENGVDGRKRRDARKQISNHVGGDFGCSGSVRGIKPI
jgi:hypothetical protein